MQVGKLGCWIQGRLYGADANGRSVYNSTQTFPGRLHGGDTPFSQGEEPSVRIDFGDTLILDEDFIGSLSGSWIPDPANHGTWVSGSVDWGGNQLGHNGDDSGTGDSPNVPGLKRTVSHGLGTENDISLVFQFHVRELSSDIINARLLVEEPGGAEVNADFVFTDWIIGFGPFLDTYSPVGKSPSSSFRVVTMHLRRTNHSPGIGAAVIGSTFRVGGLYWAGVYVGTAAERDIELIGIFGPMDGDAASGFTLHCFHNRDPVTAGPGDATGEWDSIKVKGKAHT